MKNFVAILIGFTLLTGLACQSNPEPDPRPESEYTTERQEMVDRQVAARGIQDQRVLEAMRRVPRHRFVPPAYRSHAYFDYPLPIGEDQTISQPYIVGLMTQVAEIQPTDKVLEIGTGSGYQAAVLGELADTVYTIEIVGPLAKRSAEILDSLGYDNVLVRHGDGYAGWPDAAPFNAILVTCAPPEVPEPLIDQLADGGRLVIPVGDWFQELKVLTRVEDTVISSSVIAVRFVPMTGEGIKSQSDEK